MVGPYINGSLGFRITGQTVSLGDVEFRPEFAYRWLLDGVRGKVWLNIPRN